MPRRNNRIAPGVAPGGIVQLDANEQLVIAPQQAQAENAQQAQNVYPPYPLPADWNLRLRPRIRQPDEHLGLRPRIRQPDEHSITLLYAYDKKERYYTAWNRHWGIIVEAKTTDELRDKGKEAAKIMNEINNFIDEDMNIYIHLEKSKRLAD